MVLRQAFFWLMIWFLGSCGLKNEAQNKAHLPQETPSQKGASLYTMNCSSCHGEDGKLGASGAKDLSASTLTDAAILKLLKNGKNAMPPMAALLETPENMKFVIQHIKTLRK